jgi:hypothetical protein
MVAVYDLPFREGRAAMRRISGLAVVVLLAMSADAAARCSVPMIPTFNNQTVDGRMTLNSGATCAIRLVNSAGPTYSSEIMQRPSQGTLTMGGNNRIIYRSRPGFVGADSFTYARRGLSTGGAPVVRTVRIAVNVTR